jgi:hypothetical protein
MPLLEDDLLEMEFREVEEPCRKRWIWFVYVLLFVFSVPWYLPGDPPTLIWWGLPAWVVMSLVITIGIALFTVFVIRKYWQQEEDDQEELMIENQ